MECKKKKRPQMERIGLTTPPTDISHFQIYIYYIFNLNLINWLQNKKGVQTKVGDNTVGHYCSRKNRSLFHKHHRQFPDTTCSDMAAADLNNSGHSVALGRPFWFETTKEEKESDRRQLHVRTFMPQSVPI